MHNQKKLGNSYDIALKNKDLKKQLNRQNVQNKAKKTKSALEDMHTRINLGDSPQVEEAVMISFLLALSKNLAEGFSLYQQYVKDLVKANKDKQMAPIDKKLATLNDLEKAQERMNKYTALMMQKKELEKRAEELNHSSTKANPEFTTKEQERKSIASKLKETYDGLNEIYDAYGYAKNPEAFMQALDKSREKWFGVGASVLKDAEMGNTTDLLNMAEKTGLSIMSSKLEDVMGFINNITKTLVNEEKTASLQSLVKEGMELSNTLEQPILS